MHTDVNKILITREGLADRVQQLGREMTTLYLGLDSPLIIITVLNGSMVFMADLIRHMPITMNLGVLGVSSYAGATTRSQGAKIVMQLDTDIRDRHVLVIDDILDTGNTLRLIHEDLGKLKPASLRTAVLLRKPARAPSDVTVEFIGFDIEDRFVVGYGLDFDGRYRNLPYIGVLKPDCYQASAAGTEPAGRTM